jgi:hypothetical protein
LAAVDQINEEGAYYALYCSLEELRMITDEDKAMNIIVDNFDDVLRNSKVNALERAIDASFWAELDARRGFRSSPLLVFLRALIARLDKDLVVFFDEADCLTEQPLLSFLSQLRRGFVERAKAPFPRSIALIGMRNIRDYKAKIRPDSDSLGSGSPFNVITKALTLTNFTPEEIKALYAQHTEATGQVFLEEAVQKAYYWSEGQPWLVNALAREAVENILGHDYGSAITASLIDTAAENLIKRRDVHIDSLLARLKEPRVARVLNAVIAGMTLKESAYNDDRSYCLDLGLVALDAKNNLRPANALYQEVIIRVLTDSVQSLLDESVEQITWNDGKVVFVSDILKRFQDFWRENASSFPLRINDLEIKSFKDKIDDLENKGLILEILDLVSSKYDEAVYTIILLAFLQRVVNGGALVHRQFAEGRGAVDLRISFKKQKYLIELKIKGRLSQAKSLDQLARYMDASGEKEGWLVFFDKTQDKSWDKKITWETIKHKELTIHIVGC